MLKKILKAIYCLLAGCCWIVGLGEFVAHPSIDNYLFWCFSCLICTFVEQIFSWWEATSWWTVVLNYLLSVLWLPLKIIKYIIDIIRPSSDGGRTTTSYRVENEDIPDDYEFGEDDDDDYPY